MSDSNSSRFAPQNQTTSQRLSSNTVGLVALSDFRKRRAEVLEQQEREARDATSTSTPDRSQTATPNASDSGEGSATRPVKKKKKKGAVASKLSFAGGDEDDEEDDQGPATIRKKPKATATATAGKKAVVKTRGNDESDGDVSADPKDKKKPKKIAANASVGIVPKAVTKASLQREAAERERLRKEFLALQEAVRSTEIAIPFVFYDGTDIPGGIVRVKKGDFVWVCLDKSRKIGADLGVSEKANARREWARVGVDDLMLVRGTIIIPHHYEIYFFIINKSLGPEGRLLFDYSEDAPQDKINAAAAADADADADADSPSETEAGGAADQGGLTTAAALKAAAARAVPSISTLEGASDDPAFTKVVDRRWYERHKHIYPASTWQEFDPEKDYRNEVRKDTGGNTFFYS